MIYNVYSLGHDLIDIEWRHLRIGLLNQSADASNYLTRPMAVPNDPLNGGVGFIEIGNFAIEPAQACLRVSDYGAKRLVDFVSNRGGQLPQARHTHHVREFRPGVLKLELRQPDGSHVHHTSNEIHIADFTSHGPAHDADVFDGPVRQPQTMFKIKVLPIICCVIDHSQHDSKVIRIHSSEHRFNRRPVL